MEMNWLETNRRNWDERVKIHLAAACYDLRPLRNGRGRLNPIEEAELGPVDGVRILHLQCHFGRDSLILAQRGAEVVGVDFSSPAIAAASDLAAELELTERAKFILADLYEAPNALSEPGSFDLVQRIICFQSTTTPTKCSVGRPNRIKPALETSDTVH